MLTIGSPKKYLLLSRILVFVLLMHCVLILISFITKKPLQISLDINKSALDVNFKVDYTKKRVDNIKLQTPRNKLPTKNAQKNEVKESLNLAKVLKQLPPSSKIEVAPAKQLASALEKFKPKQEAKADIKNPPKIDTSAGKKPEVPPRENNKLKNLTDEQKLETVKPEIKQNIEEELVLGREQFDEVKLALQIYEQIQAKWQPPQGLNPKKPSKWLIKIRAGQKIIEKIEGSGILVFDMAAQQTLLNAPLDLTGQDLEVEIAFTA